MSVLLKYEAVVIGASLGGTEAVIEILKDLPANYKLPIIVVLHRQKNAESHLNDILSKYLKMEIREINENEQIEEGVIYIAPSNYHVLIEDDKTFALDVSADVSYSRPSIDVLFESAALVYKEKLVGILLTGSNSDGSNGLLTISEKKGLTIVQDPEEAKSDVMPKAALSKMKVDHIFKKKEILQFLLTLNQ